MNSKYAEYLPLIENISKHNPELRSDEIAASVVKKHPTISASGLARFIRRSGVAKPQNEQQKAHAKVLIFDIETAPLRAFIWSKWQKGVNDGQIISDWFIICWSAKWLFEDEIYNACITSKEIAIGNDERVVRSLWRMMDEADIVIAHNGKKFDRKKANTRFLAHDLKLPSPYELIDTLLHARKQFGITSNRLDYIAQDFFGIEGKKENSRGHWERCMNGDSEALNEMQDYCNQDIRVREDVYLKLRPYIQPHPNIGLHVASTIQCCSTCGSDDLTFGGTYRTYVNEYESFRCNSCGALGRVRKSATPKQVKDRLTVSLPR